jgi:small subunit ribosomal protein S6
LATAATQTAEYELVLMLDPEVDDGRRDQIAAEARQRIEAGGELKDDRSWGMRKLAYEIRQRTEADYRFFRFQTASALLDELDHSLKIADGVLRFRIFKVDPRLPVIEPPPPISLASSGPRGGGAGRRGGPGGRSPRSDSEAAAEEPASAEAEAPPPSDPEPAEAGESPASDEQPDQE